MIKGISNPACPVCQQDDWHEIAVRDFKKSDIDTVSGYHQKMYHFMFEIWYPGKSVITFKNLHCSCCGFICFHPRPDIEIIYDYFHNHFQKGYIEFLREFFQREDKDVFIGYWPHTDIDIANRRSKILYNYIAKHHNLQTVQRVLDYGGFDGNLMRQFIDNGKDCFITDFCPITIPGVTRLGNTAIDLKPEDKFDLIACSHVMEHVVDPRETIKRLIGHLSDKGILYIEVPMELWKRPPLQSQKDPIMHLNYFTCNSLRNLLEASGASVNKCELAEYLHTDAKWNQSIRCIGKKRDANTMQRPNYKPDGLSFIKPDLKTYLKYYLSNRRRLRRELAKRFCWR